MKEAVDEYFDAQNMMDIEVISTLGLTCDDINELKNVEGVSQVNPAYSFDASINTDKKDIVVKIESIPEDINRDSVYSSISQSAVRCSIALISARSSTSFAVPSSSSIHVASAGPFGVITDNVKMACALCLFGLFASVCM